MTEILREPAHAGDFDANRGVRVPYDESHVRVQRDPDQLNGVEAMKLLFTGLIASMILISAPTAGAQDDTGEQVDIKELAKQVRRNMVKVEQEIDQVEAAAAQAQGEAARENLEKLIKSMQGRGDQITSDIDEIIKNIPC